MVPSHYSTAVEEEKNKRWMTSGHHGQPVVDVKPLPVHLPLGLWLWMLDFHLKKECSGAEEMIHHPSSIIPSSIDFSLNFVVWIKFIDCQGRFERRVVSSRLFKGEKSSSTTAFVLSSSSIGISIEFWLVLMFNFSMAE